MNGTELKKLSNYHMSSHRWKGYLMDFFLCTFLSFRSKKTELLRCEWLKKNLSDVGLQPKVFALPKGQFKPKTKIF